MRPEKESIAFLGTTRSMAKMIEFEVPKEHWINTTREPEKLFPLTISIIGDYSRRVCNYLLNQDKNQDLEDINFTSLFFDAIIQAERLEHDANYINLLNSAAYYLGNKPGSASVLIKEVREEEFGEDNLLIDKVLHSVLLNLSVEINEQTHDISKRLIVLWEEYYLYYEQGEDYKKLFPLINNFRQSVYLGGTPRQLLLADVLCAVLFKKVINSSWKCLREYTNLSQEDIKKYYKRRNAIREFWPSQHLLGKRGVLKGESSVVQMPTSAGKTRACEIIIRNSFYGDNKNVAVIVAPYVALCNEIRDSLDKSFKEDKEVEINRLTEVLEEGFDSNIFVPQGKTIIVATPEKFQYVMKYNPSAGKKIDLMIFDEGHQFDSEGRGVIYELLITSLLDRMEQGAQVILISAVIKNAKSLSDWLLKDDNKVSTAKPSELIPTYRSTAFVLWPEHQELGSLRFVNTDNPWEEEFYVPRALSLDKLSKFEGERKDRFFPEKDKGISIAIYLASKIVNKGAVTIFCGTKPTVVGAANTISELISRGYSLEDPSLQADPKETSALVYQTKMNLGGESNYCKAIGKGFLFHHAGLPKSMRVAAEHAIKDNKVGIIICTSTLAQGVNLPVKYLLVSSIKQGQYDMKIRDFHNLMGRVGRSGMHTEGSVIFTDPKMYENKKSLLFRKTAEILNPENSESCDSFFLNLIDDIILPFRKRDNHEENISIRIMDILDNYLLGGDTLHKYISDQLHKQEIKISCKLAEHINYELGIRIRAIELIENFLLLNWEEEEGFSVKLAEKTLAYHQQENATKKDNIRLFFKKIEDNLREHIKDPIKRECFGRTSYGLVKSEQISTWVTENKDKITSAESTEELLKVIQPILRRSISDKFFTKIINAEHAYHLIYSWCRGESYYALIGYAKKENVVYATKKKLKEVKDTQIMDICNDSFSFQASDFIGALITHLELQSIEFDINMIRKLQRQLKYGLYHDLEMGLYELGFVDRELCKELSNVLEGIGHDPGNIKKGMNQMWEEVEKIVSKYPSYFSNLLNNRIKWQE